MLFQVFEEPQIYLVVDYTSANKAILCNWYCGAARVIVARMTLFIVQFEYGRVLYKSVIISDDFDHRPLRTLSNAKTY